MFYPQNDDRIMTIDSMTSLHPIYTATTRKQVGISPFAVKQYILPVSATSGSHMAALTKFDLQFAASY